MADIISDSRRCNYFFLYDGSKVKEEGDPTREGICYFYPEETPIDKQELLCGQLAGVGRCVSEISSSPVRVLQLRRSKFAIRMKEDLFWALGCSVDIPTISVCDLLDQLINLFCFYNGPIRQSYQISSRETLALRWAHYLSHIQGGAREFYHIFNCMRTIDPTNIDPLLLLKAALILQACQRCPLVLAGCILFRGRVVSTQMPPDLTIKVMVYESETYKKEQRSNGFGSSGSSTSAPPSCDVTFTPVYLTTCELKSLHSSPVDRETRSDPTLNKDSWPEKTQLSRTLSDTPIRSDPSETDSSQFPIPSQDVSDNPVISGSDNLVLSPSPKQSTAGPLNSPLSQTSVKSLELQVQNGKFSPETEEDPLEESCYHSFYCNGDGDSLLMSEGDGSTHEDTSPLNGQTGSSTPEDGERTVAVTGNEDSNVDEMVSEDSRADSENTDTLQSEMRDLQPCSSPEGSLAESPLVPMTLYQHRVKGLVLALLVEPQFLSDAAAMKEVYHSSLASLNGLEAHLRTVSPVAPGPQDFYVFAHFDCIQNTLTTNLSGRPGGIQERSFVRGASLLHSHFYNTETLQEAILRNAGGAVYGTHSAAQETYFLQHGGTMRNSGIPNYQDSAFSLPNKARHRLLKHGVNLFWRDMTDIKLAAPKL